MMRVPSKNPLLPHRVTCSKSLGFEILTGQHLTPPSVAIFSLICLMLTENLSS